MKYKIAVLLTCFNRKEKTLKCLEGLFKVKPSDVDLAVFLTDDGSTDGTADAVRQEFADKDICILQGSGSLYWAGGMRYAWNEALKKHNEWDFYLLLNDDVQLFDNMFDELFSAHEFAIKTYGKTGLYSGVTCSPDDASVITYSGDTTTMSGKWTRLSPNGVPQMVDQTNANILLVAKDLVDEIGIFYDGYIHSAADWDYSILARKADRPALITAQVCGACDFDHTSDYEVCKKLVRMSLAERRKFFANPVNHDHDHMVFVRRHSPMRLPVAWMLRNIRCYFPSFYIIINKIRGIY